MKLTQTLRPGLGEATGCDWLNMLLFLIYLLVSINLLEVCYCCCNPQIWRKPSARNKRWCAYVLTVTERMQMSLENCIFSAAESSWLPGENLRAPDCCSCHVWLRCLSSSPPPGSCFTGMLSAVPVFQAFPHDSLPPFCHHSNTPARHRRLLLKTL